MDREQILTMVDHTLLAVDASWEQIRGICDDGIAFHTASVCIPPSYVRQAREYVKDQIRICTVIGFPNGYSTTAVKASETEDALKNGAAEIDMVINIGWVKDKRYEEILNEIRTLKQICRKYEEDHEEKIILKVIIETCLLTEEEKIRMCQIVVESGADFIKTSTGFSKYGATLPDVTLLAEHVSPMIGTKAAGGISSFEDAEAFIRAGATRLGTSRLVKLAKTDI